MSTYWFQKAEEKANKHPTILGLIKKAKWYREQSENFLNHSTQSMYQHEQSAGDLEKTAVFIKMEMIAKAGIDAGEYKAISVSRSREVGRFIQVQTDQGWNPDYFWCEYPSKTAESESV